MTASSTPSFAIVRATAADAARLASLASSTFHDTFAADNDPRDMAAYAAGAFGEAIQRAELLDASTMVLFAERGGDTLGYAMLREGEAPAEVTGRRPIEIARLYAAAHAIGAGVGSALMQACLDEAARRGHDVVWLGVWERNARAIAFYTRWRFADVGMQHFQLGSDRQVDRVMARRIETTG